jgi:hypothetical protein
MMIASSSNFVTRIISEIHKFVMLWSLIIREQLGSYVICKSNLVLKCFVGVNNRCQKQQLFMCWENKNSQFLCSEIQMMIWENSLTRSRMLHYHPSLCQAAPRKCHLSQNAPLHLYICLRDSRNIGWKSFFLIIFPLYRDCRVLPYSFGCHEDVFTICNCLPCVLVALSLPSLHGIGVPYFTLKLLRRSCSSAWLFLPVKLLQQDLAQKYDV